MGKEVASTFMIKGKPLTCRVCDHDKFWTRKTLMNTPGLSFFGFEWANREATNYVCDECGYIHWFFAQTKTAD